MSEEQTECQLLISVYPSVQKIMTMNDAETSPESEQNCALNCLDHRGRLQPGEEGDENRQVNPKPGLKQ